MSEEILIYQELVLIEPWPEFEQRWFDLTGKTIGKLKNKEKKKRKKYDLEPHMALGQYIR